MTATTRISTAAAKSAHVRSRRMLIGAALGIVYAVWGSTYLAIRIMVGEMPPLVGAGVRFLTAGLLVATVLVARWGPRRMVVTGRELAGCALIAVLLPVLGQGLVTVGEKGGAPSGITALLIAAVPLWVICYRILSGERPARRTLAGVFLGFGGVAVVIAANEMLVGGGVLTILGLASGEGFHPLDYSARSWVAWAYLAGFGSVVAFSAYVWLLQSAAVSLAATYAYVNPLVAVLLGRLILAEPVTMPTIVGGAVVVVAVAIVVSSERPPRATTASENHEGKNPMRPDPEPEPAEAGIALIGEPSASAMSPCPAWRPP
jgi:drug/metabolite transporter (DMT)-like permease